MTLQMALKLYPDTILFQTSGVAGLASPLRREARYKYGKDDALGLTFVCSDVWQVMAEEYFSLVSPQNVNPW
jgi:hypothetical protein